MDELRATLSFVLSAAAVFSCPPASAQQYPVKPVRLIVPYPPGGPSDLIGRLVAQRITAGLGQQVIVENRPGAGGLVGTEAGIKSPPDGYTLTLISTPYTIFPSLYPIKFDPVGDITPIIQVSQGPLLLVVHPSVPAATARELIALAKARPGTLNFASGGQGTMTHLAAELFASTARIRMNHVPYKGGGPAIIAAVAGHTDLYFSSLSVALPHARSGKLRAIAITSSRRNPVAPDVPTVAEAALPGYEAVIWQGFAGPKGLPRPVVDRINSEVAAVLKSRETEERLHADGSSPIGGTPEQLAAIVKRDIETWREVVRKAGIKPE
jgi:tripartite-type tricarboxylate transporter receptor subunit TctC